MRRINRGEPKKGVNIFWFRKDLRLTDNCALYHALMVRCDILPIFIYDEKSWSRDGCSNTIQQNHLYKRLCELKKELESLGATLIVLKGDSEDIFKDLTSRFHIFTVYSNEEYTPYEIKRDKFVNRYLKSEKIDHFQYNDNLVIHPRLVVKKSGEPYIKNNAYRRRWESLIQYTPPKSWNTKGYFNNFIHTQPWPMPSKSYLGIKEVAIATPPVDMSYHTLHRYTLKTDRLDTSSSTNISNALAIGSISIRRVIRSAYIGSDSMLTVLSKRGFYASLIWHFPKMITEPYNKSYSKIELNTNEIDFKRWCSGDTGYPLVDAGMRQLNRTGQMHGKIREVVASFLTKYLLIDWTKGEKFFASKLIDYNLASNVGNWQRIAGCGIDPSQYNSTIDPIEQQQLLDPDFDYIREWVPELDTDSYCDPIIDNDFAKDRASKVFKTPLNRKK